MSRLLAATLAVFFIGSGAQAQDVAAGEKVMKKCKACHMIADGDTVIFKGGKTGPNLFGIVGRTAGSFDGYKYSKSMVEAGEKGLVWDEENLTAYLQDPSGYLKDYLGDSGAKSKMSLKLRKGMEDVIAYLASHE